MSVKIEIVKEMRFPANGDWRVEKNSLVINVLATGNTRYNFLVATQQLVIAMLCSHAGITQDQVEQWNCTDCPSGLPTDPGAHPKCPYFTEYLIAENIVRMLAVHMGINWKKYEDDLADVLINYMIGLQNKDPLRVNIVAMPSPNATLSVGLTGRRDGIDYQSIDEIPNMAQSRADYQYSARDAHITYKMMKEIEKVRPVDIAGSIYPVTDFGMCQCKEDWTDGTAICQECGRVR